MSVGAFTDRKHPPNEAEVTRVLGATERSWQALIQHIRCNLRWPGGFQVLLRKAIWVGFDVPASGRFTTALYPTQNGFTVQVILSWVALNEAQARKLGNGARQAITRAKPYPEGKWLFIPVQSEQDLRDVQYLLELKTRVSSRTRQAHRRPQQQLQTRK